MRMLWQNTSTGERSMWLMNGTSWDGSSVILPQVPTVWSIVGSGDFNADGRLDMFVANEATANASVFINTCGAITATPSNTPQASVGSARS